jgi:hypothetical protein
MTSRPCRADQILAVRPFFSRSTHLFSIHLGRFHRSTASLENVLTLLMLNPEPIVFMAFNEDEGWPFPKYLGSCGRLAAFENAGEMLTEAYNKPWDLRVQISKQLLQMAMKFVNNDLDLAMYLTDWSPDNFVVDRYGKVTLVDGENFVLVDQKHLVEKQSPGWNVKHTSQSCDRNFCYVIEDLCTHSISDHNLLGVCKGLLAPQPYSKQMPKGLLHSIPAPVLKKHSLLPRFLSECAKPTHAGGRFEAAQGMLEILKVL